MKKFSLKLISLLIAAMMLLPMLPTFALAEGEVAKIGEEKYTSFADALDAANANGGTCTIVLLQDTTSGTLIQTQNASNDITIDLNGHELTLDTTFTFTDWYSNGYGVKGKLTFKNGSIVSAEQNASGETFTVTKTGTLSFEECKVSIGGNSTYTAVYNQGCVNIENCPSFSVSNTSGTGDAFYSDYRTSQLNIKNSTINIEKTSRFVVYCETLIEESEVTVKDLRAIGMNTANLTMRKSNLTMDGVVNHGYTNGTLKMYEESKMVLNNCGNIGANVSGDSLLDNSTLTITNCGGIETSGRSALVVGLSTKSNSNSLTIQNGSNLTVTGNNQGGIYVSGYLTQDASSEVVVTNNKITTQGTYNAGKGGGISNIGTVSLQPDAVLYNNHAAVAGDDIYSTGTITFGPVGSNWILDDCRDRADGCDHNALIDGWYDDAAGQRWLAHASALQRHVELIPVSGSITETGQIAYKAAHGVSESGGKVSLPGIAKKIVDGEDEKTDLSVIGDDTVTFRLKSNVPENLLDYLLPEDIDFGDIDVTPPTPTVTTEPTPSPEDTEDADDSELNIASVYAVSPMSLDDGLVPALLAEEEETVPEHNTGTYLLTFHDVMDSHLTLDPDSFVVMIGEKVIPQVLETTTTGEDDVVTQEQISLYTVRIASENAPLTDGCTFEVELDLAKIYSVMNEDGTHEYFSQDDFGTALITVQYTAKVDSEIDPGAYPNKAKVTYVGGETEWADAYVLSQGLKIYKYDATDETKGLAGAVFELTGVDGTITLTTNADGYVQTGALRAGDYTLTEIQAPNGYIGNTESVPITIAPSRTSFYVLASFANTPVPHTGGSGTTLITTVGGAIVVAAALLLLVSSRKPRKKARRG